MSLEEYNRDLEEQKERLKPDILRHRKNWKKRWKNGSW
jgi:hypothetical protein